MNWPIRIGSIILAVLACVGFDQLVGGLPNQGLYRLAILACLNVILAVSLNLINGITGQFSIGHAAFYMVGAYTSAILTSKFYNPSIPEPVWLVLMMVAGAITSSIAGFIVGLPSLRLKGDYLAIVTLGFGQILMIIVQANEGLGGAYGYKLPLDIQLLWIAALAMIFVIAVCRNMLRTSYGLQFLAVREDEVASLAMGVNITRVKVSAFVIGAAFAGLAGGAFALCEKFIAIKNFDMAYSFMILTMVVLGGTGSITGSALAGFALFALPEYLRSFTDKQGNSIILPGTIIASTLISLFIFIAAARWVKANVHGDKMKLGLTNAGVFLGSIALAFILNLILRATPMGLSIPGQDIERVRFAIFALALIAFMLLRPQGILGHKEFSLSSVFPKLKEAN